MIAAAVVLAIFGVALGICGLTLDSAAAAYGSLTLGLLSLGLSLLAGLDRD